MTAVNNEYAALSRAQRETLCRSLLEEFGSRNVSLIGDELHHSCVLPFGLHSHGDQKPSASINIEKMVVSCFVCGGGSLMWWIGSCRNTSGSEAKRWLREHTGLDGASFGALVKFFEEIYSPAAKPQPIPVYSESVLEPWKWVHPYLTEVRKIPVETIIKFQVGFDKDTNRVVIPHFWKGKLVGWVTRRLTNDQSLRYMYTPSFPKKETIYNYSRDDSPIVVEGQMDVLRHAHCFHLEATFGASVSDKQVRLLGAHPRVYLFFDNDEAGYNITKKLGQQLSAYTNVLVVENPFAADAGDMDDVIFDEVIHKTIPFSSWHPPDTLVPLPGGD